MKNEEDRKTVATAMESQVTVLLDERDDIPGDRPPASGESSEQPLSKSKEPPPSPPPSPVPSAHYPSMEQNNQPQQQQQSEQLPGGCGGSLNSTSYPSQLPAGEQQPQMDLDKSISGTTGMTGGGSVMDSTLMETTQQASMCHIYLF